MPRPRSLIALALATAGVAMATAAPSQAAGSYYGCPYGAVCVYDQSPKNVSHPTTGPQKRAIFYSYGSHNLSNEYGLHFLVDNQYGGAGHVGCLGYNGKGGQAWGFTQGPRHLEAGNLTRVNSINLLISGLPNYYDLINCGT